MRACDVQSLLEQGAEPLLKALRMAGAPMAYQRALRCVKDGVGGVRLPAVRIAGRWHTSLQAVREFISRTTAIALHRPTEAVPRTSSGTGARYLRTLGLDRDSLSKRNQTGDSPPSETS